MKKFTLVELLIILAIIGLLVTILLPSISKSRARAKQALCLSNIKQNIYGVLNDSKDNAGKLLNPKPEYGNAGDPSGWNSVNAFDVKVWDYMGRPDQPPLCPKLADFFTRDPNTTDSRVDSVSPAEVRVGGADGTLANIASAKTYFPNNFRMSWEKTGTQHRHKAGLFKDGRDWEGNQVSGTLNISEVESDTIAVYENYRCSSNMYDHLEQWGIKGHGFSGVTTGFHENRGLNAAFIEGGARFITVNQLMSDSSFYIGGSWQTNDQGHVYGNLYDQYARGSSWNWRD